MNITLYMVYSPYFLPALALSVLHPPGQALATGPLVWPQVGGAGVDQATIIAPVDTGHLTQDPCQA